MCMCACVAVLINFADGSAGNKRNTSDNLSYTKVLSVASIGTVTGVGGRPEKKKKNPARLRRLSGSQVNQAWPVAVSQTYLFLSFSLISFLLMPLLHFFVSKHRRIDFEISVLIRDLANVPLVSGLYYVKWRIKHASHSSGITER